jgi:hypothetical protein
MIPVLPKGNRLRRGSWAIAVVGTTLRHPLCQNIGGIAAISLPFESREPLLLSSRTMVESTVIGDHITSSRKFGTSGGHMSLLRNVIDELSNRAVDNDLIALLATSRQARLYNAHLARELRDVIRVLKMELDLSEEKLNRQERAN